MVDAAEHNAATGDQAPADELVAFLSQIVRTPSVNPPGDERAVAAIVADCLRRAGLEVEIFESAPARHSVVARLRGSGCGPTLILNGHTDVQPAAGGWVRDPFGAAVEDGRMFGRGTLDMKAGIAAMVFTAVGLAQGTQRLRGDLLITAVADEVGGGHKGTGFLVREGLIRGDMAVVCEPTGDQVYVAHRGTTWIEVEVTGTSAHSGRPWLGVNAISKAARIIHAIESDLVPRLQGRTHPLLPPPSINLGGIEGGTKFNLVADRCVMRLDRRTLPSESAGECVQQIRELCEEVRQSDAEAFGVSVREVMHVDGAEVDPDEPIVRACQLAFAEVTGEVAGIGATSGFEDAHFLLAAGIPTAMFGPYRRTAIGESRWYTSSGSSEEYVVLADVVRAVRVYTRLAINLLG